MVMYLASTSLDSFMCQTTCFFQSLLHFVNEPRQKKGHMNDRAGDHPLTCSYNLSASTFPCLLSTNDF